METWLGVGDYEKFYEASDLGHVMSLRTGRVMRPRVRKDGRLNLDLYDGKGGKLPILVHRLILITHVGPQPDGMECCHKDGNYQNNAVTNLYWGTRPENAADRTRHGGYVVDVTGRTHCKNLHEFTPENTWLSPKVRGRQCRQCRRDACNRSYRKKQDALQ